MGKRDNNWIIEENDTIIGLLRKVVYNEVEKCAHFFASILFIKISNSNDQLAAGTEFLKEMTKLFLDLLEDVGLNCYYHGVQQHSMHK